MGCRLDPIISRGGLTSELGRENVMSVSEETLRESFRTMDSDELLRRWVAQSFTETARPIARAEIEARGLETTNEAIDDLRSNDEAISIAVKRRRRNIYTSFAFAALSISGFAIYKALGIVVALACVILIMLVAFVLKLVLHKVKRSA